MGEFHIRVHACDVVRLMVDCAAGGDACGGGEIARHVESCRGCAGFVEEAARARALVRRAVGSERVPQRLRLAVRELIRDGVEAT